MKIAAQGIVYCGKEGSDRQGIPWDSGGFRGIPGT